MTKNKILYSSLVLAGVLSLSGCSAMLPYEDNFKCEKGLDSGVCASVTDVYELSDDMDKLREINALVDNIPNKHKEEVDVSNVVSEDSNGLREVANSISIKQIQDGKPVIFKIKGDNTEAYYYSGRDHEHIVPNDQEVMEYLIKDNEAYKRRLNNEGDDAFKDFLYEKGANGSQRSSRGNNNSNLSHSNLSNGGIDNSSGINHLNDMEDDLSTFLEKDNLEKDSNFNKSGFGNNQAFGTNGDNIMGYGDSSYNNESNLSQRENCQSGDMQIKPINGNVKVCVYAANIRQAPSCKAKVLKVAKKGKVMYAEYEQGGWVKLSDGTFIHRSIVTIEK